MTRETESWWPIHRRAITGRRQAPNEIILRGSILAKLHGRCPDGEVLRQQSGLRDYGPQSPCRLDSSAFSVFFIAAR